MVDDDAESMSSGLGNMQHSGERQESITQAVIRAHQDDSSDDGSIMVKRDDDEESVMQMVQGDDGSSVGGSVMQMVDDDDESVMQMVPGDDNSSMSGSIMQMVKDSSHTGSQASLMMANVPAELRNLGKQRQSLKNLNGAGHMNPGLAATNSMANLGTR